MRARGYSSEAVQMDDARMFCTLCRGDARLFEVATVDSTAASYCQAPHTVRYVEKQNSNIEKQKIIFRVIRLYLPVGLTGRVFT